MAVVNYEPLGATDVTTTKTLLHESIPLTGTIVSGTYGTWPDDTNVKNYTHGMFQSVYDYPYLSSSANHIFDLTVGYTTASALAASLPAASNVQQSKKQNMYTQFAQVLLGYTGSTNVVRNFESDLTLDGAGKMKSAFFVNFSRLLYKDEVKKGTVSITLGTGSWASPFSKPKLLTDASASSTGGTSNTLGGDYGLLYDSTLKDDSVKGVVFYQAGIAVITSSAFVNDTEDFNSGTGADGMAGAYPSRYTPAESLVSASISGSCNALRHRVKNISFNNTTEINSTIYFCRVPHNKYNYSSNPTYLSASQIRVKNIAADTPVTYITTIGLYNANNQLLASAKLSEPLKKDPSNEIVLRVRLDY
jgi:hypothetical protein